MTKNNRNHQAKRKEKPGRGEVFPRWIKRKERIAIPSFACSLIETTLSLTL